MRELPGKIAFASLCYTKRCFRKISGSTTDKILESCKPDLLFNRLRMETNRVYKIVFGSVYPLYLKKVESKGRSKEELDTVIFWLTGYNQQSLQRQIEEKSDLESFFAQAPAFNTHASKITGVICGYRVEEIEDKLIQKIRYLDKLVDELAKGKAMEKILRN